MLVAQHGAALSARRTGRRYGSRQPRATKLDPFKDYVLELIAAARPRWSPATVLLRELHEIGYAGGISQLKAFLAPHKRPQAEPVVRFDTPPGKQMQADFTVIRRGRAPLLALLATLGYSRASFVRFTAGEDATTLCDCLREAFVHFGGAPEQVLFDNAKSVVVGGQSVLQCCGQALRARRHRVDQQPAVYAVGDSLRR